MIENKGVFNGKRILSQSSIDLSRKNFSPFDSGFRGIGWILKSPSSSSCGDFFMKIPMGIQVSWEQAYGSILR